MQKLVNNRLNQVYQNQKLGQIIRDLARRVLVEAGTMDTGQEYPYFLVHESKNVLRHIQELAIREGMDVYIDPDNKLTVRKFEKSRADHTFYFGIDILDLDIFNYNVISDHIVVYGESPASNQGLETWHWMTKDLQPFRGEVGQGGKALSLQDGAIRTKDGADRFAKAKLGTIKDRATGGRLKILGNPTVTLGDAIEIKNVQKPELNGVFKVTSIRHLFDKRNGFITWIAFAGRGGAQETEGLLGQLAGQIGGALGL
jgi:hypothetical protein